MKLQWGRYQLIAELAASTGVLVGPLTLQWGRDQLIAELHRHGSQCEGTRVASMGPRSIDRGTPGDEAQAGDSQLLQWGRDQLIAELMGLSWCPLPWKLLQWGRDQLIAELQDPVTRLPGLHRASMGPRSIDRGTRRWLASTGMR